MRIVVVIDIYDLLTNGTVMTAYRFVEELKKKGHTVKVVGTGAVGEDCFNVKERMIPLATQVARLQQIRFAKADKQILTSAFVDADVVHLYLPFKLEKVARKIAKRMNIPCTAAFHLQPENVTYNMGLKWSKLAPKMLYSSFRKKFFKHFKHIHCPSKFIADQLRNNKYKAKLHVISNGVDRDFVPPAVPRKLMQDGKINILMIGRFANEKRQDVLIKACGLSKYADKIQLYLAGKGPTQNRLANLAKKKMKNQPIFGFYNKQDLIYTIHNMDLYVHAADIEIEAIACIEAFSCGVVPIIANSKKSATPQFAIDERSLFEAGNPNSLAQKIDYLIEHSEEKEELSAQYIKQGEKYCIDYSITKAEEMFAQAIDDHFREKAVADEKKKIRKKILAKSFLSRFISWIFYYIIAAPIMGLYLALVLGFKVKGKKNLKKIKKKGAISVSNHVFSADCTFVGLAVFPKKLMVLSDMRSFKMPYSDFALKILGGVKLPANEQEETVFKAELNRLYKDKKRKRIIHMYPEKGLVNYYAGIREFNNVPFEIACDLQIPILPISISWRKPNAWYRLWRKDKPCPTVVIGDALEPDYIMLKEEMEQDLKARCMENLKGLYESSNAGKNYDYWKLMRNKEGSLPREDFCVSIAKVENNEKTIENTAEKTPESEE